jgi:hypothetical protein
MKVIISHDIDHLTAWEHRKDFMIPKFVVRSCIETGFGYVSASELMNRIMSIMKDKWQNISELISFDKDHGIPSTFFVAVSNGRSLRYSLKNAEKWMKIIQHEGFAMGVHGIAFTDSFEVIREHEMFVRLAKLNDFGIRLHDIGNKKQNDVKVTSENLVLLERANYVFSSNTFGPINPYKIGSLWEFPIGIMDGYIFNRGASWQTRTLEQSKEDTKKLLNGAYESGISYFSILFHDFFFSDSYVTQKSWYTWLTDYCRQEGLGFCSYKNAIKELEQEKTVGADLRTN